MDIRKAFLLSKSECRSWLADPRISILFILVIYIHTFVAKPLLQTAELMEGKLNYLEIPISLGSSGMVMLILPVVFLVLISDFPRIDSGNIYYIYRSGRINWLIGEILYYIWTAIAYLFFIVLGCVVMVYPKCSVSFHWSYVVTKYNFRFPEKMGDYVDRLLPKKIYIQLNILEAFMHTYLLLVLYLFLLGEILLVAFLVKKKKAGIMIDVFLITAGSALCEIKSNTMWLFPMAHTVPWLHYTDFYREPVVPIGYSYLYFIGILIALFCLAMHLCKKYNYISMIEKGK